MQCWKGILCWLFKPFLLIVDAKSPFGSLIVDAKSFTSCFKELHYSHTKRKGNKVAHSLAQHARHVTNYVVWMEFVPPPSFFCFLD